MSIDPLENGRSPGAGTGGPATSLSLPRRFLLGGLSLLLAAGVWLPLLRILFTPASPEYLAEKGVPPMARALAARHLRLWNDPVLRAEEIRKMRSSNAEWDFMARTFLVLALANMALRDPAFEKDSLAAIDRIIEETLRLEKEKGPYFFLMDYARNEKFRNPEARSLFLDGEIALMLGARLLVRDREDFRPLLEERAKAMTACMERGPVLCGESYPNECWTFCNAVALAAIRTSMALGGEGRSDFLRRWTETARKKLTDPGTGLLVSSFDLEGRPNDGPEGSTIWLAAHMLQVVDEPWAKDQYERARKQLARRVLGFGFAREWPVSWRGPVDVDSGPVVPILDASPASSGLALVGAAAFDDLDFLETLVASLRLAGFPRERDGELHFAASNPVGDAVLLYALVEGPLWRKIREARHGEN